MWLDKKQDLQKMILYKIYTINEHMQRLARVHQQLVEQVNKLNEQINNGGGEQLTMIK